MRYLVFMTLILFIWSCDKMDFKLHLTNHSGKNLYYQTKLDTIIYEDLIIEPLPNNDTIKVGIIGGEGTWEYKIQKKSVDSTLHVYIFFDENVTDEVVLNKNYSMKGFKVKDLERLHWIVTYPDDFE